MRLPAAAFTPSAVAYDRASARFVLADRRARKLVVVDERLHHVTDLVGAESAGFYDIKGFEIDSANGDLWVVSATDPSAEKPATVLHKLQLVSGRPIASLKLPASFGAGRFDDVTVGGRGTVFVLDGLGKRIFRLSHDGRRLELAATLHDDGPVSIAAATDRILYVADAKGIARVDSGTGSVVRVSAPKDARLAGFEHLQWTHDALVGIQKHDDAYHIVKVTLPSVTLGLRASSVEVIERDVPLSDPSAAAWLDGTLYFVQRDPAADGELVVRRARVP